MMDKNCRIIQDLIPLCAEKVASNESVEFVKAHCETCENCKKIYKFSEINLTKNEKEYDDKMQKIWKNIERQETAKKRKKILISGFCGFIVSVFIFFYVSSCFHGTVWTIGFKHNKASKQTMEFFDEFTLYEPKKKDIEDAAKALKEHFRENHKGKVLLNLIYDEYITYSANYDSYTMGSNDKTICFTGKIVETTDIPKLVLFDVSTNHKWKVEYKNTTNTWEVSSLTKTVTMG